MSATHERLVALQSDEELRRKADKAQTRSKLWQQEEIDYGERYAKRLRDSIRWDDEPAMMEKENDNG